MDKRNPAAIIVDVDGTLADRDENNPYSRGPFEWHRVGEDLVHHDIADLVRWFDELGFWIIVVSGRMDDCKDETLAWLLTKANVKVHKLFMRASGDHRPDEVVKKEIFLEHIRPNFYVKYVLDDRDKVVRMWRDELGLRVLQVADGAF